VSAASGVLLLGLVLGVRNYSLLLLGFMLAGYGTAAAAFGTTLATTQGVADGEQGLAGGLINMSRQVGAALGVAVAAAVIGTGATSGPSVGPDRSTVLEEATTAGLAVVLALSRIKRHSRMEASTSRESPRLHDGGDVKDRTRRTETPSGPQHDVSCH
jgi:hypothetical protein